MKKNDDSEDEDKKTIDGVLDKKFQNKAELKGVYYSRTYPFTLLIQKKTGDKIFGTIEWSSLNSTITRFKGSIDEKSNSIQFEEYEVVEGDDVDVPNKYNAVPFDTLSPMFFGTCLEYSKQKSYFRMQLKN